VCEYFTSLNHDFQMVYSVSQFSIFQDFFFYLSSENNLQKAVLNIGMYSCTRTCEISCGRGNRISYPFGAEDVLSEKSY